MHERIKVLRYIINKIKAKHYLEIGLRQGFCFIRVDAPIKTGVDPDLSLFKKKKLLRLKFKKNKFYEMTSDNFFLKTPRRLRKYGLDVVFIDGLHTHEQTLKDVLNCLKFLNKDGIIVLHDSNPLNEMVAYPANSRAQVMQMNLPDFEGEWSGDVWKTIPYLRSTRNDLNIFVVDCDYGLAIIKKDKPEVTLDYSLETLKKMDYSYLERNREKLLNLKDLDFFYKYFNSL